jgi:2-polyprenyl-6-methoxyphenol hydroxylase-like FAD-dependent oxidoreductase
MGLNAEIFEARERAAVRRDPRVLALSDGARQILDWLGVWTGPAGDTHRGPFTSRSAAASDAR